MTARRSTPSGSARTAHVGGGETVSTNGAGDAQTVSAGNIRWGDLSVQSTAILRQVLVPIHMGGYSLAEVAKRLSIPQPAVKLLAAFFAEELSQLEQSPG